MIALVISTSRLGYYTPCTGKMTDMNIGPYSINVCPDGDFVNNKFPLVVISHGGGGSHLLYRIVALHLAQNGYVVAMPWSRNREKIEVTHDERIKALVLFAPAAAWFQHPDSLESVGIPIIVYSAEHDTLTPYWHAELIKQKVKNPALVTIKTVKNAGHL